MRIGVITARYSVSGVPLAQARLASALASAGHKVDYVIGDTSQDLKIPEPHGTQRLVLGAPTVRAMIRPLCRYLRKARPELIFCAEDHLNVAVAIAAILTRSNVRISASSRVGPSKVPSIKGFSTYAGGRFSKNWIFHKLVGATAWRMDMRTCVSRDMVDQYQEVFPKLQYHAAYNIVVDSSSLTRMNEPVDDPWFPPEGRAGQAGTIPVVIAAGSLEFRKGFDDLVRAIGQLHLNGRQVRLLIFGEGSMHEELLKIARDLGISSFVRLPGVEENPLRFFKRSTVIALTSHAEGLPNVLVEGMMAGATPVATDCPTGPREVLGGGRYGYLATPGDPTSIAHGIALAIDRPITPERLSEAVEPFTETAVLTRHSQLLGLPLQTTQSSLKKIDK